MNNSIISTNIPKSVQRELLTYISDNIDNYIGNYICDLHNHLFNEDYYIIGYYNGELWLKEHYIGTFNAIGQCIDFELEMFGETNLTSDDMNAERIVNLLVYFYGYNIINTIFYDLDIDINKELTEFDIMDIKEYIENEMEQLA